VTSEPPRRGELYFAELEEIGQKLVLVVSWDRVNELLTPLVCQVTATQRERSLPTFVPLDPPEGGVWRPSAILCHNVVTLETWRFATEPIGTVSEATMKLVNVALQRVFDLGSDERAEDAPAAAELPPAPEEPPGKAIPPRDA
jgi:mRNA interferase MazF